MKRWQAGFHCDLCAPLALLCSESLCLARALCGESVVKMSHAYNGLGEDGIPESQRNRQRRRRRFPMEGQKT